MCVCVSVGGGGCLNHIVNAEPLRYKIEFVRLQIAITMKKQTPTHWSALEEVTPPHNDHAGSAAALTKNSATQPPSGIINMCFRVFSSDLFTVAFNSREEAPRSIIRIQRSLYSNTEGHQPWLVLLSYSILSFPFLSFSFSLALCLPLYSCPPPHTNTSPLVTAPVAIRTTAAV